jgi:hypothetical protein
MGTLICPNGLSYFYSAGMTCDKRRLCEAPVSSTDRKTFSKVGKYPADCGEGSD